MDTKIEMIELKKIDLSTPYRKSGVNPDILMSLRENISKVGLRNEPEFKRDENGNLKLISGYSRTKACVMNWIQINEPEKLDDDEKIENLDESMYEGWTKIPGKILTPEDRYEELELVAGENLIRDDMNPVDLLDLLMDMKAAYVEKYPETRHGGAGANADDEKQPAFDKHIADRLDKSRSWVKSVFQLNKLHNDLKEIVRQHTNKRSWALSEQKIRDGLDKKLAEKFKKLVLLVPDGDASDTEKERINEENKSLELLRAEVIEEQIVSINLDTDLAIKVRDSHERLGKMREEHEKRRLEEDLLKKVKGKKMTLKDAITEQRKRDKQKEKENKESNSDSLGGSEQSDAAENETETTDQGEESDKESNSDSLGDSEDTAEANQTKQETADDNTKDETESGAFENLHYAMDAFIGEIKENSPLLANDSIDDLNKLVKDIEGVVTSLETLTKEIAKVKKAKS